MKFSINQAELQNALTVVVKGSSSRSVKPILAGVYIQASEDNVVFQTTDEVLSVKLTAKALVEQPGRTVAPVSLLLNIVKKLPDMAVVVETDESGMNVYCNNTTFSLKTLDADEFPLFPQVDAEEETSFPYTTFASMVRSTARVASHDETRPILTGVLVVQDKTDLKMVATDSYRLALVDATLPMETSNMFEAVVAGTFLQDLASLPMSDDPVKLALSENQIVVTYQNTTFINRRIEGRFPNYRQLIADDYSTRATLNTQEFLAAVGRVSLLSNKVSPIAVHVDAEAGSVTLSTRAQDVGNAQETILCPVEGETVDIAFNYHFLQEGLQSIQTETVNFDLSGSMKPGILRAIDSQDEESFLHLIMPVRM